MASMFPIVMFILNLSSVAVLWFGAHRIDAGQMQIGSLTAFLTYMIQILMSVMMATFLLVLAPRAMVCAERIQEVLQTESSVADAAAPVTMTPNAWHGRARERDVHLPGRGPSGAARHLLHRRPGRDHRDHRLHRRRQDDADLADLAAVRCNRRLGPGRRGRGPRARPRGALEPGSAWSRRRRTCSPARWPAICATAIPTPTDEELWHALRIAQADGFRPGHAGAARGPDQSGRHERLRRTATATVDRPGLGEEAGDLHLRRLVLGARRRDRCPIAGGAARRRSPTRR